MLFVDIEKSIGDFALKVCFETNDAVLSLIGISGSGKSMTLKCIAGLEKPDKGKIVLNDRVLFDSENGINLSPKMRRVGYLFQQYALFPNMSVRQNVEVALHHLPKNKRAAVTEEKLKEFHIKEIENKKPCELSGGEQQRVALARLIASDPEVLLLDEPFSALDSYLKWQFLVDIKNTISQLDKDVILVTHSVDEVLALTDKMCVLDCGKSEPVTDINDALTSPRTVSTAKLFGCKNFSKVEILSEEGIIACQDWGINIKACVPEMEASKALIAGIFSQDIELINCDEESDNCLLCTVSQVIKTEEGKKAILKIDGRKFELCVDLPSCKTIDINESVKAYIPREKLLLLEE